MQQGMSDRMERGRLKRGEKVVGREVVGGGQNVTPGTQDTDCIEPVIDEKDWLAFPAVSHQPAHCPNCGSADHHIYKTLHPTNDTTKRYHICNKCVPEVRFRSLEELNRVDFVNAGAV